MKNKSFVSWLLLIGLGCFFFWKYYRSNEDFETLVAMITAGFALLAIFMQRKELSLQRDELKETRKELEGQKKEAESQNKTLSRQRFENTFFHMLKTQMDIVDGIVFITQKTIYASHGNEIGFEDIEHKGFKSFEQFYLDRIINPDYWDLNPDYYEHIDNMDRYDNYFRHLYRIIKFVDESVENKTIKKEESSTYIGILRSQLSAYELVMICYNGLSVYGIEKCKPLLEKYHLLKNLRQDLVWSDETKDYNEIIISYTPDAYYNVELKDEWKDKYYKIPKEFRREPFQLEPYLDNVDKLLFYIDKRNKEHQ